MSFYGVGVSAGLWYKKIQFNLPAGEKENNYKQHSLPGVLPLKSKSDVLSPTVHRCGAQTRKKAALCISRGSLTVEAAFLLPLFLLLCLAIFSMLDFYRACLNESMELAEKAEKWAMYAYLPGRENGSAGNGIQAGPDGYITLTKPVEYRVPYSPLPLPPLRAQVSARVHAWTGAEYQGETGSGKQYEEMVFVTENGSVYHTSSACTHLSLKIYRKTYEEALAMKNAGGGKYRPCEKCTASGNTGGTVYVTEWGNAYHSSRGCSGLKRSVRLVKKSEVRGMPCCEKCAAA